ncbi:DUF2515 domain-containing protein [Bacillus timonensis]|nr:DUF2515 domain-containing protein [Bacillus timonensis]
MDSRRYFLNLHKEVITRRKRPVSYTVNEQNLVKIITRETEKFNKDNISRTGAYANYFDKHRNIRWAFLASMVSRNAGWNMCDLEGKWFPISLKSEVRKTLFLTYERANWLIFLDAYPQLLLYKYSLFYKKPLFHLFKEFQISSFIETEWELFWKYNNEERLLTSLIINEQNVIQKPVIEHPFYKQKVFKSLTFKLQDWLHFSSVIFPTIQGELYGLSVNHFRKLNERIVLGKKLSKLLFHPRLFEKFYQFSLKTTHTGSRRDYEQYMITLNEIDTPFLRTTYPIIEHKRKSQSDWFTKYGAIDKFYKEVRINDQYEITQWYLKKRKQLKMGILLEYMISKE